MKQKKKLYISVSVIMMSVLLIVSSIYYMEYKVEKENVEEEIVLFSGEKTVAGGWNPWETAVEVKDIDLSCFEKDFIIAIEYESKSAPIIVFSSTKGGESWSQVNASYTLKGVAYYTDDACKEAYGNDFSTLTDILVKPFNDELTVTRVTVISNVNKNIDINFKGTSGEIFKDINVGWNLGNSLDSEGEWITKWSSGSAEEFETAWGNPVTTEAMIDKVKESGFNAIRIPVTWNQHIGEEADGYKIDADWIERVKEVVDYAINDDMYVILNLHHDVGKDGWLYASRESVENNKEKFKSIWIQIADEFKDYDNKLMFEGFNEILTEDLEWNYMNEEAGNAVNTLNQMFVDTVRSTGGKNSKRCLVVNTYAASTDGKVLEGFIIPKDTIKNSLMVGVHFYTPASYARKMGDWTKQSAWQDNGGKGIVDGTLLNIYNNFTSKGIPVIMSEVAASNKENEADRAKYAEYVVNQSEKYGIKCFWWDEGGSFEIDKDLGYYGGMALFDRRKLEWVYPDIVKALTKSK